MTFLKKPKKLEDMWTISIADKITDRVVPLLPWWLEFVVTLPIPILVVVGAAIEYGLRYLLTPQKYWNQ